MEFFYYSKRCRKQRQMGRCSTSILGTALYGDIARAYATKAQRSMHDLTFPRFDGQPAQPPRHRAFDETAIRCYLGPAFAR